MLSDVEQRPSVHGLNLVVPEDAKAIIKPWAERDDTEKYAESNVDDQVRCSAGLITGAYEQRTQLIIHIPFTERVRIRSILLKLGEGTLGTPPCCSSDHI